MHIGIDFDDVLYPYHAHLKRRLKERFGVDLSKRRVTTFYYDLIPEFAAQGVAREQVWAEVRAAWDEVEAHEKAPLLDRQAPSVIRALQKKGHTVTLVTARHADRHGVIPAFLKRHRIAPDTIVLGRHEKSGFDVLVDDFPSHVLENAASGGWGLLYSIDENSNFDETRHPRVVRVAGWGEVRAAVERIARGPT